MTIASPRGHPWPEMITLNPFEGIGGGSSNIGDGGSAGIGDSGSEG